jgi:hypothetical protein
MKIKCSVSRVAQNTYKATDIDKPGPVQYSVRLVTYPHIGDIELTGEDAELGAWAMSLRAGQHVIVEFSAEDTSK